MELPEGHSLLLQKSIYGLVQASRQWGKKFVSFLAQDLGFSPSKADPCILWRTCREDTVYITFYIDDSMLIRDPNACERAVSEISSRFTVRVDRNAKNFIGRELIHSPEKERLWISQ